MSTVSVSTFSSAHTVAHVTTKMLSFMKEIIRELGLDPGEMDWPVLELGVKTWLDTGHLKELVLEVYDPRTDGLVGRWDLTVIYSYAGDGSLWDDKKSIKYHIEKAGLAPANCKYRIVADTASGRPDVPGWSSTSFRSTDGLKRYSIGSAIGGTNIGTQAAYWRK